MPTLRALLRAFPVGALALAAACADSTSSSPDPLSAPPPGPAVSVRLECTAEVAQRTVQCAAPAGTGAGVRTDRIYGQGTAVKLTSSNVAIVADSFTFDLTVTNLLEYPVGTTDGVNPDPNGIRVFFVDGIHTTEGTGSVTVANGDGVDAFTAAGQAYFRYLGVLQPGATTAARRWKLRFEPGVQTFAFGLYVSTPVPPGGGTVQLTILQPLPDSVFVDSVVVRVRIDSSPASLLPVKAYVADRSVVLAPYAAGLLRGTLPLTGLGFGTYLVRVHAVTVRADSGNAYVSIRKDAFPTLTVTEPTANVVARPNLRIDADCVDDNPAGCASVTARLGNVVIASGTNGVHSEVSLAGLNETQTTVQVDALDSGGHQRTYSAVVYVQSGLPVFVDSAGSQALAVDSARLLFATTYTVWLRDRGSGARTSLQTYGTGGFTGYLFPQGAIFSRAGNGSLAEWRNGALSMVVYGTNLVVEGNWAAYSFGRRNLATGTTEFVTGGVQQPDIAPNGDLVYDAASRVYRLSTASVSTLVDSGSTGAVTDGINVVYLKSGRVTLWNGATRTVLSNPLIGAAPHSHYEVNAGWTAYAVLDGGGATQLHVRAPDGTDRAVTAFGTSSLIRALSAEGTLVFGSGGSLYAFRAPFTGTPTRIGRDWFSVRFRGTELQLYLGNSAFTAAY